jgi:hypothetical protein
MTNEKWEVNREKPFTLASESVERLRKHMDEQKTDKKSEGPGGAGMEKDEGAGAEVAGRGRKLLYTCFADGAGNYVESSWTWFRCWRCGGLEYI